MDRISAIDLLIKNLRVFIVDVLKEFKGQLLILVLALVYNKLIEKRLGDITSITWKHLVIRFRKSGLPKTRASRQLNPTVSLRGTARSVGRVLGARLGLGGDDSEAQDKSPTPPEIVPKHAFDGISIGLNEGYPSIRHRQNAAAYYYADGPNVSVSLNGQAVTSHAGRLLPSPPPLCINVSN